jgi:hypothetical protein
MSALLGMRVQRDFRLALFGGGNIGELRRPDRIGFHHERFAIGIERIGHEFLRLTTIWVQVETRILADGKVAGKCRAGPASRREYLCNSCLQSARYNAPMMLDRGKVTVVAILVLAAAAGGYAVWSRSGESPRAIKLWGPDTAKLLVNAPQVEVRRVLEKPSKDAETASTPNDHTVLVGPPRDLTAHRDLAYIRRSLLNDKYFDWQKSPQGCEPHWAYVVRFSDGEKTTTVWIDDQCQVVQLAENPAAIAVMRTDLLNSIRRFLDRYAIRDETAGPRP